MERTTQRRVGLQPFAQKSCYPVCLKKGKTRWFLLSVLPASRWVGSCTDLRACRTENRKPCEMHRCVFSQSKPCYCWIAKRCQMGWKLPARPVRAQACTVSHHGAFQDLLSCGQRPRASPMDLPLLTARHSQRDGPMTSRVGPRVTAVYR